MLRSTEKKFVSKIEPAKTIEKLKPANNLSKSNTNVLRSSEKKIVPTSVQKTVPTLNQTKSIVKQIDFVKLDTFQKNSIVLAKQKFSFPWPARVLSIEKEKTLVYFFGDKREGYVS